MKIHRKAGGVVVRITDGGPEILLIHRNKFQDWSLPKGHVEKGERAETAAIREVREETGYDTRIVKDLGEHRYTYKFDDMAEREGARVAMFLMELARDDQGEVMDETEVNDVEWVGYEEALKRLSFDQHKEVAREAVKIAVKNWC